MSSTASLENRYAYSTSCAAASNALQENQRCHAVSSTMVHHHKVLQRLAAEVRGSMLPLIPHPSQVLERGTGVRVCMC